MPMEGPKSERPILGTALSRDELVKFLPPEAPLWFSQSFACTFTSTLSFDEMQARLAAHLESIPGATKVSPFNAPPPFRAIVVELDKKQWSIGIKPHVPGSIPPSAPGKAPPAEGTRWSLEITFRDHGRSWGSNYAIWWMLRRAILPLIDATDEKDGPNEGAQRVFPG